MTYIVRKPAVKEHLCDKPDAYYEGVGTVWRCDNANGWFGRILGRGCGKHYMVTNPDPDGHLMAGGAGNRWVEVSWPPPPS